MTKSRLIDHDPSLTLTRSVLLLTEKELRPRDCPSPQCLALKTVRVYPLTQVIIEAHPPRPSDDHPGVQAYEVLPICRDRCGIRGNPHRGFDIVQDPRTGEVVAYVDWMASIQKRT